MFNERMEGGQETKEISVFKFISGIVEYFGGVVGGISDRKRALLLCAALAATTPGCHPKFKHEGASNAKPPEITRLVGGNENVVEEEMDVGQKTVIKIKEQPSADPSADTSEPAKTSEYLPIDNVDISSLDLAIKSIVGGNYTVAAINCVRPKGVVAIYLTTDNTEHGDNTEQPDSIRLFMANTDDGFTNITPNDDFIANTADYLKENPDFARFLTQQELANLMIKKSDGFYLPIEEVSVNYY